MRVETMYFENTHGKKPRGKGNWAFEIKGETYFFGSYKSYMDAKKEALAIAKEVKACRISVLP